MAAAPETLTHAEAAAAAAKAHDEGTDGEGAAAGAGTDGATDGTAGGEAGAAPQRDHKGRLILLKTRFFVWGWNDRGQLALGTPENRLAPIHIKALAHLEPVDMALGKNHGLYLTRDRTVWVCGDDEFAQLGIKDLPKPEDELYEETRRKYADLVHPEAIALTRGSLAWAKDAPRPRVTSVACGHYSSYCVADGRVHAWGRNDRGQLGIGNKEPCAEPSPVPYVKEVTELKAGGWHVCALDAKAQFWVWGRNSEGQLGLGHQNDEVFPTRHPFMRNCTILTAGAGEFHTGVILETEDDAWLQTGDLVEAPMRALLMWGDNRHGAVGIVDREASDFALETTDKLSDRQKDEARRAKELDDAFARQKWSAPGGGRGRRRRRGGGGGGAVGAGRGRGGGLSMLGSSRRIVGPGGDGAAAGGGADGDAAAKAAAEAEAAAAAEEAKRAEEEEERKRKEEEEKKKNPPLTMREKLLKQGLKVTAKAPVDTRGLTGAEAASVKVPGGEGREFILLPQVMPQMSGWDLAQVACGRFHTLVLVVKKGFEDDAKVYSFGDGSYGQLGVGDTVPRWNPTEIKTLRFQGICQIYASGRLSGCISQEGLTFTWGLGYHGDGGHGDAQLNVVPVAIDAIRRIRATKAASGERSVAIIGTILPKKMTKEEKKRKAMSRAQNVPRKYWRLWLLCVQRCGCFCVVGVGDGDATVRHVQLRSARSCLPPTVADPAATTAIGIVSAAITPSTTTTTAYNTAPRECALWVGFAHTESGSQIKMRFSCAPCKLANLCRACARQCHRFHAVTCVLQNEKYVCECGALDSCRALPAGDTT